jgi:thymidylate synthase (FAD)
MILLTSSYKIETPIDGDNATRMLKLIESAARTCYKSECKATADSHKAFVRKIANVYKHESVIEHSSVTVRFIVDRGVSHELVRHRLCAFSQESTRYVDYSEDGATKGNCQFIIPPWCNIPSGQYKFISGQLVSGSPIKEAFVSDADKEYMEALQTAEDKYNKLAALGWTPQQARDVLPNSTKTEVVVTTNLREWRHIFKLRADSKAHPQMREVMIPLLNEFKKHLPELFDNISV